MLEESHDIWRPKELLKRVFTIQNEKIWLLQPCLQKSRLPNDVYYRHNRKNSRLRAYIVSALLL